MSKTDLPPHGNTKYPWTRWENGRVHRAVKGLDFDIDADTFRKSIASRATYLGKRAKTRVSKDKTTVTFKIFD